MGPKALNGSGKHMCRLTLSNEQITIYDDLLPREAFDALFPHALTVGFDRVHREEWQKEWRLGDGTPMQGPPAFFRADTLYEEHEVPRYPTGAPIDAFFEAVRELVAKGAGFGGTSGTALTRMTIAPAVYGRGCGLSLHRDRFGFTGTYTYFIHPEWNFHWGGQLLVLDPRTPDGYAAAGGDHYSFFLSDEQQNRAVAEPGIALCILPKPNRFVFIAPDTQHMVTRVDANAGDRPRTTLVGYLTTA
ncbi:MAG TPA: 2OG-Fe(II) oxygenase [Thermoanaerobaculia bacterium]|nr:2OG-Fe(II) oxygenase [Thermoanaerobaculia bacterium]